MRPQGGEQGQQPANVPMGGGLSRDDMMETYLDGIYLSMNQIGDIMENMVQYLNIAQPPNLGNQYPYCVSWSEIWSVQHDGAGNSGTHADEEDE